MIKNDENDEFDLSKKIKIRDNNDDDVEKDENTRKKIWRFEKAVFLKRLVRTIYFDIFVTHATIK